MNLHQYMIVDDVCLVHLSDLRFSARFDRKYYVNLHQYMVVDEVCLVHLSDLRLWM